MSFVIPTPDTWFRFSLFSAQMIVPQDEELEFLAANDSPCGTLKKGDIVRGRSMAMSMELFSHWRPIPDAR